MVEHFKNLDSFEKGQETIDNLKKRYILKRKYNYG